MNGYKSKFTRLSATCGLIFRESAAGFMRINGFDRAAALAFYAFLSLIPLLFLEILVVTHIVRSSETAVELLGSMTDNATPVSFQFILRELFALSVRRTWGLLTLAILLWSATPLASGIRNAFNAIFRPRKTMAFLRGLMLDVSAVMVLLALLGTGVIFRLAFVSVLPSLPSGVAFAMSSIYRASAVVGLPLGFLIVYRILVPVRLKLRNMISGSVLTSCMLWAMGPLFSWILRYNPNLGVVFGSLKTIFLLFVWVYYSAIAILFGTEIMANISRRDVLVLGKLFSLPTNRIPRVLIERYTERYEPCERIFSEGDRDADAMYYVMDGQVILSRNGLNIATISGGEYFGEMAMLLDAVRTTSATAGSDGATLVVISKTSFEAILHENPSAVLALLKKMAERLQKVETLSRTTSNTTHQV